MYPITTNITVKQNQKMADLFEAVSVETRKPRPPELKLDPAVIDFEDSPIPEA